MSAICSDSGIDTVRFRWRTDNEVFRDFLHRPEGTISGYRGESFVQTELGRIGAFPDGMVYLEGRASAILAVDRNVHSLASVEDLTAAERVARDFVTANGADVSWGGEAARLGRIDLASELRFSDSSEGSAFLHSLASLDVPWCKSRTDGRKGNAIETVSFHGTRGHTIYLRAYDKGVESGTDSPGKRIRVERQKRYRKDREPATYDLTRSKLRSIYVGREFERLSNLPSATVCDIPAAMQVLWERATTWRQFERLAAFIVAGAYIDYPRTQMYARSAELRAMGLFVDPTQIERLEVPVGQYLKTLSAAWAA